MTDAMQDLSYASGESGFGFLAGNGEMNELIRAFEWSQTTIGPISGWPRSLRTAVSIVLHSPVPMVILWGPDGIMIYNDAYSVFAGGRHPRLLGSPVLEGWPEVADFNRKVMEVGLAGGTLSLKDQQLVLYRRGSPENVSMDLNYSPILDESGKPAGVLAIVVETTQRVLAEQALARSQERLSYALNAAGMVGTFDWHIPSDTFYSDARFAALFSVDPEKGEKGASLAEYLAGIHPDDVDRIAEAVNHTVATGEKYVQEYRLLQRDGTVRWIEARGECLYDSEGKPWRFPGVVVDTTERKEAEEALRETTLRLNAILNNTMMSVFMMDDRQHCIYMNDAAEKLTGYFLAEVQGRPLHDLIHHTYPDGRHFPIEECAIDRALPQNNQEQGQEVFVHKTGSFYPVAFTASPIRDEAGKPIGTVIEARNIEEELQAKAALEAFHATLERRIAEVIAERETVEAQLRQAQKMEAIGQLTGGIAHDFNNLLQGIIGSLDLVQKRVAQGRTSELDRFITGAMTSANRAAALTHRLLAFARRQPLNPKPVNANPLVASMEDLLRRTLGETIELELVLAEGLWPTLCDENQLESAILNLVINARDAMPTGGKLTIETCNAQLDTVYAARARDVSPGQYVCICVTDTGMGMPPEVLERAFDPFFTTKASGEGTGLGLSMIYGFARQSEGYCKIYSEVSKGTTVKLYLPRHRGATVNEEPALGLLEAPAAREGEVVVVVEDESVVRGLIVAVLTDLGYRVLEAEDGPSGVALLESTPQLDLLITDIGLPGLNGRQVADAARARWPGLKVLFMTGYAENAANAKGFLEPGMSMLTKPFAMETLATCIRNIIKGD